MNEVATRTLVVERHLKHPAEKVWRALTEPVLIEDWLMKNDFRAAVGHKFNLRTDPVQNWSGVLDCEVLEVEPQRRLSYTWNTGEGPERLQTVVTYTLIPEAGGVLLRMEQSGFVRENAFRGAEYGWGMFLTRFEQVLGKL